MPEQNVELTAAALVGGCGEALVGPLSPLAAPADAARDPGGAGDVRPARGRGGMSEAVRVERDGPVTTVLLSRPERRNAVDGADRGRAGRRVPRVRRRRRRARGGAARRGRGVLRRRRPEGGRHRGRQPGGAGRRRPDGADADAAGQAGDRRGRGARRRGRARAGAVVRPARGRGGRGARRVLPALGRAADRRRHRAAAAAGRREPGDGHDPDRPACRRRGGAGDRAGRTGWSGRAARAAAEALAHELAALPADVHAQDRLSLLEQDGLAEDEAMANELRHGMLSLAEVGPGVERFRAGAGRHGSFE